jgi:hypothetical protein
MTLVDLSDGAGKPARPLKQERRRAVSVLLVSYDLDNHAPRKRYEDVEAVIQRKSSSAIKALYSQWLVQTNESPQVWADAILAVADKNTDRVIVTKVTHDVGGRLDDEVVAWLRPRLQAAA